jgi:small subunit ribosomal protein S6
MKLYELTYLMPIDLPEESTKALQERMNTFIADGQGTIDRIEDLTKKRLGEPHRGQNMAQMSSLNFYFAPEKLDELKKKIKSENQIIHYLILNKKPHKAEAPRRIRKMPPAVVSDQGETIKTAEKPKKVEIKEIEKKLEEILGE